MSAFFSLLEREIKRFYRQPSRIIGVFGLPLLFWVILGFGFGDSFQQKGHGYLAYFFPGSLLLVVLFTSIFSNMSLIEDRHDGFLQGVLVSPAGRPSIALGKILGGALLGLIQGALLLPFYWFAVGVPPITAVVVALGSLFLIALSLSALGFAFAWRLDSIQGFHGVMNLILMPLWIVSGALFPIPETGPVRWLMTANPLYYGLTLFRDSINPSSPVRIAGRISGRISEVSPLHCALVLIAFGLFFLGSSVLMMARQRSVTR